MQMVLAANLMMFLAGTAPPTSGTPDTIHVEAASDVYFSSAAHTDRVTARIAGASCEDALFTVTIHDGHEELFRRVITLFDSNSCDRLRQKPEWSHWALVNTVNEVVGPVRATDRTCGGPRPIGCWVSPDFERMRRSGVPLVCFTTGAEASSCVAFDQKSRAVVEVWRYSE